MRQRSVSLKRYIKLIISYPDSPIKKGESLKLIKLEIKKKLHLTEMQTGQNSF